MATKINETSMNADENQRKLNEYRMLTKIYQKASQPNVEENDEEVSKFTCRRKLTEHLTQSIECQGRSTKKSTNIESLRTSVNI